MHSLILVSFPKIMPLLGKVGRVTWSMELYDIPEGLPGTRENVLWEASLLPEIVHNAIFFPSSNYIPQSKENSGLRKRLNWQCLSPSCAFVFLHECTLGCITGVTVLTLTVP